jgi:hypothetical protein
VKWPPSQDGPSLTDCVCRRCSPIASASTCLEDHPRDSASFGRKSTLWFSPTRRSGLSPVACYCCRCHGLLELDSERITDLLNRSLFTHCVFASLVRQSGGWINGISGLNCLEVLLSFIDHLLSGQPSRACMQAPDSTIRRQTLHRRLAQVRVVPLKAW